MKAVTDFTKLTAIRLLLLTQKLSLFSPKKINILPPHLNRYISNFPQNTANAPPQDDEHLHHTTTTTPLPQALFNVSSTSSPLSASFSTSAPSSSSSVPPPKKLTFETLQVQQVEEHIYQVKINRPEKGNAISLKGWSDIRDCFEQLDQEPSCRVILLSANGKNFCAGIDLNDASVLFTTVAKQHGSDTSRNAFLLRQFVRHVQNCFDAVARCSKPVIAVVHGACVGAGLDLIAAADIRVATKTSLFSLREVKLGLAADVGSLQRLPKVLGNDSLLRQWAFTGGDFGSDEAEKSGLLSYVGQNYDDAVDYGLGVARKIRDNSPVAVTSSKLALNYARDHSVSDSLEMIANWNMVMLQSPDVMESVTSKMVKKEPKFEGIPGLFNK